MSQNAILEVNLSNFKHNYNEIKKLLKSNVEIMPILKDNAYGTYINTKIDLLNELDIKIIGVAKVYEGVLMRKLGFDKEIFILNQPLDNEIPEIAEYNLTIGCGSIEYISKLRDYPANFNIHMEIGTGMGRTGIRPSKTLDYINEVKKSSNITITGIYTHFSCSDSDKNYTEKQINSFNQALEIAKNKLTTLKYIHTCNSAGIINFPEAQFNLVRPGILLYGHYPAEELKNKIQLKPATKLKAKISFMKKIPAGSCISYGKTFITTRDSKIATITIGYADGVRRTLSNKGNVIINGKIAPIIGTICMDCFMVDITDIDAKVNDDVFIWDNKNITVEDIAGICDTINYEILTGISQNVYREFIC